MSEAAASTATVFCTQCGRAFPVDDLMLFGGSYVCAECKPAFLQRVREGGGVATNLRYASFGLRFVALLLDGVIGLVVGLLINIIFRTSLTPDPAHPFAALLSLATLFNFLFGVSYYVFFLTAYGATLGKMAVGVKIVTADGGPISFGRALARYFCTTFLEIFTLWIGYLIALFDDQNRTLHDRICGTRAIATR
jgi:uncharacterized RDD family membrane protein YckC